MKRFVLFVATFACGTAVIGAASFGPPAARQDAVQVAAVLEFDRGLHADVVCWLSAPLLTLPDELFPASVTTRMASVSAAFTVKQVLIGHVHVSGPVDTTSARPVDAVIDHVSVGLADVFAATAIGVPTPDIDDTLSGPYTVRVAPKAPLKWGEVQTSTDLSLVAVLPTNGK